jgi:hypothetical protein
MAGLTTLARGVGAELSLAVDTAVADTETGIQRYASSGDRDLGAEAIRQGLALAANGEYQRGEAYRAAEAEARKAQRGLWSAGCGSALVQTLAARNAPAAAPSRLPRGNADAAKDAIAELQQRNDRGENRVEHVVVDVTAPRPTPSSSPDQQPGATTSAEDAPAPGRARQLSGPRIRQLGGGRVRVEGTYWNSGETKISGRVRVELRDDGAIVDSGSVRLVLEPDGEGSYAIELSPGTGIASLSATATWESDG